MALVPAAPADDKPEMCLCLLPNIVEHSTSFPHDMVKDEQTNTGLPLQACTVKTVVRVGVRLTDEWLIANPNGSLRLKTGPNGHELEVTMTVHQASTGREVTNADISGFISATGGRQHASLFESGTLATQRLSMAKPSEASENDPAPWRAGAAREMCAAEVTFAFRFKFTPQSNLTGCDRDTKLFLRFSTNFLGLHIETEHFRLVAKRDRNRVQMGEPPARPLWGPPPTVQPSLPVGGNPLDDARTQLLEAEASLIKSLTGGHAGVQEALVLVQQAQSRLNAAGGDEQPLAVAAEPVLPPSGAAPSGAAPSGAVPSGAALELLGEGVQELAPSRIESADVANLATDELFEWFGLPPIDSTGGGALAAVPYLLGQARQFDRRISPEGTPGRAAAAAAAAPAAYRSAAVAEDEVEPSQPGPSSKRQKLETLQRIFKDGFNHHQTFVEPNGSKRLAAIVRNLTALVKEAKAPQHKVYEEMARIADELNDFGEWLDFVGENDLVGDGGGGAEDGGGDAGE